MSEWAYFRSSSAERLKIIAVFKWRFISCRHTLSLFPARRTRMNSDLRNPFEEYTYIFLQFSLAEKAFAKYVYSTSSSTHYLWSKIQKPNANVVIHAKRWKEKLCDEARKEAKEKMAANKKLWNGMAECSFYANHSRVPRTRYGTKLHQE